MKKKIIINDLHKKWIRLDILLHEWVSFKFWLNNTALTFQIILFWVIGEIRLNFFSDLAIFYVKFLFNYFWYNYYSRLINSTILFPISSTDCVKSIKLNFY